MKFCSFVALFDPMSVYPFWFVKFSQIWHFDPRLFYPMLFDSMVFDPRSFDPMSVNQKLES